MASNSGGIGGIAGVVIAGIALLYAYKSGLLKNLSGTLANLDPLARQSYMNGVLTQQANSTGDYNNGYFDGVLAQQAQTTPTPEDQEDPSVGSGS